MRGEKQMNRKEKKAVGLLKALNNLEKKCKIEKVPYKSKIKKIMISLLPEDYGIFEILLNLIEKLQKENEELKEDRKNNNEMIALAQNEILNYMSGYEDGKKHKMTAAAQVVENQQYYIVRKQMEKYEEHIKRLQKENEEWQRAYQEEKDKQFELLRKNMEEENLFKVKVKDKIEELKNTPLKIKENDKYYYETDAYNKIVVQVLQELLEGRK